MKIFNDWSIKKRLLVSILLFSFILVCLVTSITSYLSYGLMKEQLIHDQQKSSRWLQERIALEIRRYRDIFFKFEVDNSLNGIIRKWGKGADLESDSLLELITALNTVLSVDTSIASVELYNYKLDSTLRVERTGASLFKTVALPEFLQKRDSQMQSNLVFFCEDNYIVMSHQIFIFFENKPIALMTIRILPHTFYGILDRIKTIPEESAVIFNDEFQVIQSSDELSDKAKHDLAEIAKGLKADGKQDLYYEGAFWFFSEIDSGRLNALLSVPNKSITHALKNNFIIGISTALAAIIFSILISVFFAKRFSEPVIALSNKMRNLTIDDYHDREAKTRKDEIGILQDGFNIMVAKNQKLIKDVYENRIQRREAQIRALQAQINPHFMYNTLQTIGGMALSKNAPEIYGMTTSLSDMMRFSLDFSKEMVYLREEIRYVQSYLGIYNKRFDNQIELDINIEDKQFLEYKLPKLILQPIIENCLTHGLADKSEKKNIWFSVKREGAKDEVRLTIKDNGLGMSTEKLQQLNKDILNAEQTSLNIGEHIGLKNVNSRLILRYGEDKYGLNIESVEVKGTIVSFLIKRI